MDNLFAQNVTAAAKAAPTWEDISKNPVKYWGTSHDPLTMTVPINPTQQAQFDFSDFGVDFIPLTTGEWWELYCIHPAIAKAVYKRKTGWDINLEKLSQGQKKLLER